MKLHIFHLLTNKVWGGGERYALDLCKATQAHGTKVTAIVRRKSPTVADTFRQEGIDTVTLGLGGAFDIITPIKLSKLLDKAAKECDRIVLHVHNFKDATTALRARVLAMSGKKIKVVCTRHLIAQAKTDRDHTSRYNAIDRIIFVSQIAHDEFMSSHPQIDAKRLHVLHNSIAAPKPSAKPQTGGITLLYTGRIVPEKGVETLIHALSKVEDKSITLNICGTGKGEYINQLQLIASDLNVDSQIHWLGHVESVWSEIARADIGIMPSTWREPFGLSLLEYMSQGLAVITTNNGAQPEIITDGKDGLLVPPADSDELANAISKLAKDSELRHAIGCAARKTYLTHFDYETFYKKINEIYLG
jgi:glycosyltransferase involved in cell wall biosynthesis